MSKGSDRRPQQVSEEQAQANWERIFGRKADNPPSEESEAEQVSPAAD